MGRRQDPGRHPQRGGAAWLVLGAACTVLGACGNGLQLAGDSPSDDRAASDVASDDSEPPDTPGEGATDEAADRGEDGSPDEVDDHGEDDSPDEAADRGEADAPDAASTCGNGVLDPGEECDGEPPRSCETECGTPGEETCRDCRWTGCLHAPEECNGVDDDCDGRTDEERWCWSYPLPAGDELYGVSASPGGDVWILGRYGTALQRVGSSWRQHCVPLAWGPSDWGPVLLDVWPDGAGQAWIAGWSGIARWDGRAWSVTPDVLPPAREYEQGTLGLWGSSPHDLWAVGAGGGIAHWTGDAWSRVDSGTTEHLHDVFGLSSDVAWAGGDGGTLLRWDGSAWSRLPTPFCRPLMASCDAGYLWASGVDDLYVTVTVCTGTYPFEECSDRLWHWDGTDWTSMEWPRGMGIWGTAADDVWIASRTLGLLHWDGATLVDVPLDGDAAISGMGGPAANDVWFTRTDGAILHWDGTSLARTTPDRPEIGGLGAVWGIYPDDVWAGGEAGLLLHWDGEDWSPVPSGTGDGIRALHGSASTDVWALGSSGPILHWDGTGWSESPTAEHRQPLAGIWAASPDDAWAVGSGPTIMRWDGSRWALVRGDDTSYGFDDVWGASADDVWVVGDESLGVPLVEHWDGEDWSPAADGLSAVFDYVWGAGPDDVWMTGILGRVARWDGGAWRVSEDRSLGDLMDIWTSPDGTAWTISGRYDAERRLLRYDGAAWSDSGCVPTSHVSAVWGDSAGTIWAVGRGGVLRWREP